jgi:hypothetical protein
MEQDATQQGAPAGAAAPAPAARENLAAAFAEHMADLGSATAETPAAEEPPAEESAPSEAEGSGSGKDDSRPELASLPELADYLETTPEEIYSLKVPVKVDGEAREVPLRDVIKSYQLESHVNNKSVEVSNLKKQAETERQQFLSAAAQELQRLQGMGQYAQQLINEDFHKVDWTALRATNPAEYSIKRQEFQERQTALNQYLTQVQQSHVQQQAQAQWGQQAKLAGERQAALAKRPEWANMETFRKDYESIASGLRQAGFSEQEINSIADHRVLLAADAAARYWALQQKKPEVTQRVKLAPKLVKPGTRKADPKGDGYEQAKARLRKTHSDDDAAAAFTHYAERRGL